MRNSFWKSTGVVNSSFAGDTAWQNVLGGRDEIGTLFKPDKIVETLRGMESGRHSQSDQTAFRKRSWS
jgi:hypothetical protein